MKRPSVVFHSHFYQPPREDPWTDRVPIEASAAPFRNWNERVLAECYRPVTEARMLDAQGRIREILNTLEWMSWDAGPTLLRWLAREAPGTYAAFLEADARSRSRLGFGNAIAAPYHHVILPLASRRDKVTEVRWGMADFRRRFGREPQGMWLPEAAVDRETLQVLAQEGIAFTILGPDQVEAPPAGGLPGRVDLGDGRRIAVFVYDGGLSHGVAFGSLLGNAEAWIEETVQRARHPGTGLVAMATDGETFGHHHPWSDMALAATLAGLEMRQDIRLENFASLLNRNPPADEVTLIEPSSWSCAHGVDRWRAECGCKMAPHIPSQQAWRATLRETLEELAADLHWRFEDDAGAFFDDVWAVRDAYGDVLDQGDGARAAFVRAHASATLRSTEVQGALRLLESERDALRMFTSCGWFYDDLAGLEPLQVLRYAAHALDVLEERGGVWEERLRSSLATALSNDPVAGDGRRLWDERVRLGDPPAAGAAEISSLLTADAEPPYAMSADVEIGLISAVRQFLRAPGSEAAKTVMERSEILRDRPGDDLLFAQSLFAREAPRGVGQPTETVRTVARALGFGESYFGPRVVGGTGAVGFVFGLHLHQPVGNFDAVFKSHTDDVYLPFLERLSERGLLPVTLHVSGPLLQWLEEHDHGFLDLVGRLAADGQVELLLSGLYEPVLPALSRAVRVEQILWMKEWVERRFGVEANGLWLTERVWEPDLVEDLVAAEVRYAFVDDRHFQVAGFNEHQLHRPHITESGGRQLALLPIDEKLRYLVPFRPPAEIESYFRALRAADQPLAILADDGEKFGGWPGTAEWVWESGWLAEFLDTMDRLIEDEIVEMVTAGEAVDSVPMLGPSYLPSASYREMETWSLPTSAAIDLEELEGTVGLDANARASRFIRGGHWRNFFAIYPESSRMHRKAQLLSDLCRTRDAGDAVRHAIGRAQCNDAYWHGVFGGLYLRHLREAIWANLAMAEEALRGGEQLSVELSDVDGDGHPEFWIHSGSFSAALSPHRGGALVEYTDFATRRNYADVLTRRWESYHRSVPSGGAADAPGPSEKEPRSGMPSIHDLEPGSGIVCASGLRTGAVLGERTDGGRLRGGRGRDPLRVQGGGPRSTPEAGQLLREGTCRGCIHVGPGRFSAGVTVCA
jgi:alpha-amylase/alpha-mannosidase (GH57 family)